MSIKEYKYGELDRVMSKDEFDRRYLGEFITDKRYQLLLERLKNYYDSTPDNMCNKKARRHYILFRQWCVDHGYSNDDINKAKKDLLRHN